MVSMEGQKPQQIIREQSSLQFMRDLLKPDIIDKNALDFWAFIDKETILANADKEDINRIMKMYSLAETSYLLTKDRSEIDFITLAMLNQTHAKLYIKLLRAKEGFERKMLVSQIQQQTILTEQQKESRGFLSGVRKFFGMG